MNHKPIPEPSPDGVLRYQSRSRTQPANSRDGFDFSIVLDPFMGSGTTALVALQLSRRLVGIELKPEYIKMAKSKDRAADGAEDVEKIA
jgi:hypothetical protein